ncbi:MAG: chromate efflux transporter [Chitinophagaceae bacterium]|nr:chromate efflux transporter [Chitinophagaceae bacterium]
MRPRALIYLKDIFLVAITSFGGPQGHLAVMNNILVDKRRYFTHDELLEVNALCQMLPGPASTQTIIVLTQKKWNVLMAILALLVWILPASLLMSLLVAVFSTFETRNMPTDFLMFIQPMAIGVIAHSGFKMGLNVIGNRTGFSIMLLAIAAALSITTPWTFPLVLLGAAIVTNITHKEKEGDVYPFLFQQQSPLTSDLEMVKWKHAYRGVAIFFAVFILAGTLALVTKGKPFVLFENFFRFGALTFGGGSVLVPMMFEQFVKHHHYISATDFLSGLAINQALPGPSFALAAFTGGMALKGMGATSQFAGCVIGIVAIFLPGTLIAFIVYPFWQYAKSFVFVRKSLIGINAASVGLVLAAAVILYSNLQFLWINMAVVVLTFLLLEFTKIKAPLLVLLALLAGIVYSKI